MLQNATPLRKSAPWPPNISDEHVSCTAPATRNASLQILFKCPMYAIVFGNATKPWRFAHFSQDAHSLAPATRIGIWTSKSGPRPSTSQLPKVLRSWSVLYILTSKCASRHNGVHFFDISTSKSAPNLVCFAHFDFEMCYFHKCSKNGVFCTFWLRNVLRTTTACNFSFLIWPDGSAPAVLASLLFDPPEPQIIGKTQWVTTFLSFPVPASSFFWLFSSLIFSLLLFSSHLCFSICPYCRKFDF